MIDFNEQQLFTIDDACYNIKHDIKQIYEISGPAGSGKTTIVREITNRLGYADDEVLYMALVGKATLPLALNGLLAKTIHSSIYDYCMVPKMNEDGSPKLYNGRQDYTFKFVRKDILGHKIKLVVVDEGGMVPPEIALDIISFNIPIIVLGDLNQLPPIFGKSLFLQNPDSILTMVMRQALNDPIVMLSQEILKGFLPKTPRVLGDKCRIISKDSIPDKALVDHEMVICGTNRTRDQLNHYIRNKILGITGDRLQIGEKVICRQNNWKERINDNIFLVNGLTGFVEYIYPETFNRKSICIDFRPDFLNEYFEKIVIDYEYPLKPYLDKVDKGRSYYNLFELANAITCHLAQGSQAESVLVYAEYFGNFNFNRRWLYTAVTRARKELTVAV